MHSMWQRFEAAIDLRAEGMSYWRIARELGSSKGTIQRQLKRGCRGYQADRRKTPELMRSASILRCLAARCRQQGELAELKRSMGLTEGFMNAVLYGRTYLDLPGSVRGKDQARKTCQRCGILILARSKYDICCWCRQEILARAEEEEE